MERQLYSLKPDQVKALLVGMPMVIKIKPEVTDLVLCADEPEPMPVANGHRVKVPCTYAGCDMSVYPQGMPSHERWHKRQGKKR